MTNESPEIPPQRSKEDLRSKGFASIGDLNVEIRNATLNATGKVAGISEDRLRESARELLAEEPELIKECVENPGNSKGYFYSRALLKRIFQRALYKKDKTIRGRVDERDMLALEEVYANFKV